MAGYEFFTETDLETIESLRQAYRKYALENHPDKHEEDEAEKWTATFKRLQAEYDMLLSIRTRRQWKDEKTTYAREKTIQAMIDKAMKIPGVYIELCGCWLWISGDTFMQRARLRLAGFKWSKKKQRWYWGLTMTTKGRRKAKYNNMEAIYNHFGREVIGESEAEEPLLITGG